MKQQAFEKDIATGPATDLSGILAGIRSSPSAAHSSAKPAKPIVMPGTRLFHGPTGPRDRGVEPTLHTLRLGHGGPGGPGAPAPPPDSPRAGFGLAGALADVRPKTTAAEPAAPAASKRKREEPPAPKKDAKKTKKKSRLAGLRW